MKPDINKYKGIRPGKVIDRELKKRGLSQRELARQIGEHSQSLNAVINGHRSLTTALSIKLDRAFGYDEGFLLALQAYYNAFEYKLQEEKVLVSGTPDIRKIVFWDTIFDRLDWGRYRDTIIQRVLEYGSEDEKEEIARFYGICASELTKKQ